MKTPRPIGEDTCEITSLNHDGTGVGRCDGKVVFVAGALPGEEVRFRYGTRKRRYDTGIAQDILRASPERVTPECPHFGVCGGCCLQHLDSKAQLRAKEGVVSEAMTHIGKITPEAWDEPLAGPVWHYRRKARLGVRVVPKKGGVLVGFRERQNAFITPLTICHTLESRIGDRLVDVKTLLEGLSCPTQIPQIEFAGGDTEAALVFRHLAPLTASDQERIADFGRIWGFSMYSQSAGAASLCPIGLEPPPALRYRLPAFDVELAFGPLDFVQINAETNRAMVSQAVEWLDVGADTRVVDLFCGLGNFTLPLGRRSRHVTGIEGVAALIERARANAAANGLAHIAWHVADLDSVTLADLLPDRIDAALLDPPRTGALAAVSFLAERRVPRLVYVSCNPATLARDAAVLVHQHGYRLARLGVVDMFPHTHHVEAMALFLKNS